MNKLHIKSLKRFWGLIGFLLICSASYSQNETMYIMDSGFIEQEVSLVSDIDSILFKNRLELYKDGVVVASYSVGIRVDSVVFQKPKVSASRARGMLEGIYWMLNLSQQLADQNFFFLYEVASDDRLGGGGVFDRSVHPMESLLASDMNMLAHNWDCFYKGIYRVNTLLAMLEEVPDFKDEVESDQIKGEALFMRAFFLAQLSALHGEIPLPLNSDDVSLPAASIDQVYGQIAADLQDAIGLLPSENYVNTKNGRATKWAAQALMARVFLFYTGFYEADQMPSAAGEPITRDQVIAWLEDCVANSGHQLADDFHELWAYTNAFTIDDYQYIQDYMSETGKDLSYVADFNQRNPESVFAMTFSGDTGWDEDRANCNTLALYFGLRGMQNLSKTFPFAGGWGQAQSVSPALVEAWLEDNSEDPRLWGSVLDIAEEIPNYEKGQWDFVRETDYSQKKCIGISAPHPDSERYANSYDVFMRGTSDIDQLAHLTDLVLIRYADVLLMLAELSEDAGYLNQVRARAGLTDIPYSLENLQKERRYELAFEGVRWNDMRRWGMAYAKAALESQEGVKTYDFGVESSHSSAHPSGYSGRYEATKGFFPIPQTAIDKSEGLLQQVPGWDTADVIYEGYLF